MNLTELRLTRDRLCAAGYHSRIFTVAIEEAVEDWGNYVIVATRLSYATAVSCAHCGIDL